MTSNPEQAKPGDLEWVPGFHVEKKLLDDTLQFLYLSKMCGTLYPKGDPTQRLALILMGVTGRVKEKK